MRSDLQRRLHGTKKTPGVTKHSVRQAQSIGSSSSDRSHRLLSDEFCSHGLLAAPAAELATALVACASEASDASAGLARLRAVLRHLRQRRSHGAVSGVREGYEGGLGAAAAARQLWEEAAQGAGRPGESFQVPPGENAEDGVAVHVVPPMGEDAKKACFVVRGVLSAEECEALIARCDAHGWHAASLDYGLGSGDLAGESMVDVRLRDSDRCILYDDALAAEVWQRLRSFIVDDTRFNPLQPSRVNPCFRCLKYSVGQAGFAKHVDGRFAIDGAISRLTIQLYLNDGFEGGATRLCHEDDALDTSRGVDVVPRRGMALIFDQSILHKGSPVLRGTKYSARTEVMYTGCGP